MVASINIIFLGLITIAIISFSLLGDKKRINSFDQMYTYSINFIYLGLMIIFYHLFMVLFFFILDPDKPLPVYQQIASTSLLTVILILIIILTSSLIIFSHKFYYYSIGFIPPFILYLLPLLSLLIFSILCITTTNIFFILFYLELMNIIIYFYLAINNLYSLITTFNYFILSTFFASLSFIGCLFIYLSIGTLDLPIIIGLLNYLQDNNLFNYGAFLILTNFSFKFGFVPFHFWIKDLFLYCNWGGLFLFSTFPKIIIIYLLSTNFNFLIILFKPIIILLIILTLIFGTGLAINTDYIRCLIGYSTIVQTGFLLAGLLTDTVLSGAIVIFGTVIYIINAFAIFLMILILERSIIRGNQLRIIDLFELWSSNRFFTIIFAIILCSFAGLPPFPGFIQKYYILFLLIFTEHRLLALILFMGTIYMVFYYFRLSIIMFFTTNNIFKKFILMSFHRTPQYIIFSFGCILMLLSIVFLTISWSFYFSYILRLFILILSPVDEPIQQILGEDKQIWALPESFLLLCHPSQMELVEDNIIRDLALIFLIII
jgi:NADH-quinone oxidoreductase subunit N